MDICGWIPYDQRTEWANVSPIFQNEDEKAVANIAYSEKFSLVFAYFRSIVQTDEKSERAFELTKDAALLNPANYSVWKFRRDLITHLKKDISKELSFCRSVIEENPKNYQVWHHLKLLVESSGNYWNELAFTDSILKDDSKNYHAWQHRQWVVKAFDLWSTELDYSDELLSEDIHNNSAWNYRYYVIKNTTGFPLDILDREIKFTSQLIKKAPHNESAWNYLTGLTEHCDETNREKVWTFCNNLYEQNCRASHLLSFMVFSLQETLASSDVDKTAVKLKATQLLNELNEIDPVRANYWRYLKDQFT